MKKFYLIAMLFLAVGSGFASDQVQQERMAVVVMGPSCAGKSSLAETLRDAGGDHWRLVELDVIEDSAREHGITHSEQSLIQELVHQSNQLLADGHNVIVDTNVYNEQLKMIDASLIKYILVCCPLNVLKERDQRRNLRLRRSAEKAADAALLVELSHASFQEEFSKKNFDLCLDSSVMNKKQMVKAVEDFLGQV